MFAVFPALCAVKFFIALALCQFFSSPPHCCLGDSGWDIFSLEYIVDGPLTTIFTPDCRLSYLKAFNFLWRLKRMEFTMSGLWQEQLVLSGLGHDLASDLTPVLHVIQLLGAEIRHFVQQLQYYVNFEVRCYTAVSRLFPIISRSVHPTWRVIIPSVIGLGLVSDDLKKQCRFSHFIKSLIWLNIFCSDTIVNVQGTKVDNCSTRYTLLLKILLLVYILLLIE